MISQPNVKAFDTRPYASAPIPPTARAAILQHNDDQPMSQDQDPGAGRSPDSNSDDSPRLEAHIARILETLERHDREKADSIRELTKTVNHQTRYIKELKKKLEEFEAKSTAEQTSLSTMIETKFDALGNTLLNRMEELLSRDDEHNMDGRSVTEPPITSAASNIQPRSLPPAQNSFIQVADSAPMVSSGVSDWPTSSRDDYAPIGPSPSRYGDPVVQQAYATTAFQNDSPNRQTPRSQPTHQPQYHNQYNGDSQVCVVRRLDETARSCHRASSSDRITSQHAAVEGSAVDKITTTATRINATLPINGVTIVPKRNPMASHSTTMVTI